jgi:hypothetical protein
MKYQFIALIIIAPLLVSCLNNKQTDTSVSPPVVLNQLNMLSFEVETFLHYKEKNNSLSCYIKTVSNGLYCFNIVQAIQSTEQGNEFVYAAESGIPLSDNFTKNDCHLCTGSLKFYKFEVVSNELKLVSKSDLINCGPFGEPCKPAYYKLGNREELGWVISSGDMHQGIDQSYLQVYAAIGKKIKPILSIDTGYSNVGYGFEPSEHSISDLFTKITTIPSIGNRYYDLSVEVSGKYIVNKKTTPIDFKTILKWNRNSDSYDTSSVDKIYHDYY